MIGAKIGKPKFDTALNTAAVSRLRSIGQAPTRMRGPPQSIRQPASETLPKSDRSISSARNGRSPSIRRKVAYVSLAVTRWLTAEGIDRSVGSVRDAFASARAETTVGSFKNELIRRQGPWRDADHIEVETLGDAVCYACGRV